MYYMRCSQLNPELSRFTHPTCTVCVPHLFCAGANPFLPGTYTIHPITTGSMTKKLTAAEKKERRPASRACVFCHRKHLQCSNERPCKNCVKRNIGHECHDVLRKRAKYLAVNSETTDVSPPPEPPSTQFFGITPAPQVPVPEMLASEIAESIPSSIPQQQIPPPPPQNSMLDTTKDVMSRLMMPRESSNDEPLEITAAAAAISKGPFRSKHLNDEYLMLGDILSHSIPTSPSEDATHQAYNSLVVEIGAERMKESRPFISLGFSQQESTHSSMLLPSMASSTNLNHNLGQQSEPLTPIPYMSPMMTHNLYQMVQDIYSHNTMNYDYPQSYHALTYFLRKRFSGNNLPPEKRHQKRHSFLVILKLIASYRPTFISAHKNLLKPYDLQFLEMTFQRSLIDYEKLSQLNSSPTIMWRRTGEIVSITDDLLSLLGFDIAEILGKRTFIMELMYDDESITNYFKLFKSIAVGNLHSSIMTKLKLMKNTAGEEEPPQHLMEMVPGVGAENYVEFCSVWTVKRDIFDIPMLIIGQFLPVLPTTDGIRMY